MKRRKFSRYGELSTDRQTHAYPGQERLGAETMVLEDTLSGRELLRIPQPDQRRTVALAPDAQMLVTTTYRQTQQGIDQHTFHFWERATGKECLTIRLGEAGQQFLNHGMAFSADGRLLAGLREDHRLQVWDVATGQELWHCQGPAEPAQVLLFTPDGTSLITGHEDSTILVWKLPENLWRRHHPRRAWTAEELESWWAALAGNDTRQGYQAIWNFVDAPEDAVMLLAPRLKPAEPIPASSLQRALGNLDSNQFRVREAAEKRLASWYERAEPAQRAALEEKPSLEKRRRIERLLARPFALVTSAELLRQLRAVRVLEQVAGSGPDAARLAAIDLLKHLAAGDPGARLTNEAKAALERIKLVARS